MRFATTVALSTLALAATATAVPVAGDSGSEGTGRGSCHHHGKSQHKKMTSTKCQNIKGATVVGYKSDGNCYDKAMLSHFATLHPSSSGTCYYVPSKSGLSLNDLDERSLLEARGTKTKLLLGAVGAGLLWHAFKPKHKEHHEEYHEESQSAPSSYESREFYDYEDLNARDFEDFDYLYGRDLDVLEGRSVGKVLLGAAIGGIAAHEWGKHEKKKEEESED
ncbi:hypothetical protein CPB84DRAFT_1744780 [Gymnopilus junonius]|uniref:Uncharacterized protein n=1 Tax=Gymnopilus junonius TaxID=109634 RepID=A0A9P5NUC3_GYMJU|nr:hypothetical protein CPB84DRAFT_1744780 [Gymnopilus junonius]